MEHQLRRSKLRRSGRRGPKSPHLGRQPRRLANAPFMNCVATVWGRGTSTTCQEYHSTETCTTQVFLGRDQLLWCSDQDITPANCCVMNSMRCIGSGPFVMDMRCSLGVKHELKVSSSGPVSAGKLSPIWRLTDVYDERPPAQGSAAVVVSGRTDHTASKNRCRHIMRTKMITGRYFYGTLVTE